MRAQTSIEYMLLVSGAILIAAVLGGYLLMSGSTIHQEVNALSGESVVTSGPRIPPPPQYPRVPASSHADISLVFLTASGTYSAGAAITLEANVCSVDANTSADVNVIFFDSGSYLSSQAISLSPGSCQVVSTPYTFPGGTHTIEANAVVLNTNDPDLSNNGDSITISESTPSITTVFFCDSCAACTSEIINAFNVASSNGVSTTVVLTKDISSTDSICINLSGLTTSSYFNYVTFDGNGHVVEISRTGAVYGNYGAIRIRNVYGLRIKDLRVKISGNPPDSTFGIFAGILMDPSSTFLANRIILDGVWVETNTPDSPGVVATGAELLDVKIDTYSTDSYALGVAGDVIVRGKVYLSARNSVDLKVSGTFGNRGASYVELALLSPSAEIVCNDGSVVTVINSSGTYTVDSASACHVFIGATGVTVNFVGSRIRARSDPYVAVKGRGTIINSLQLSNYNASAVKGIYSHYFWPPNQSELVLKDSTISARGAGIYNFSKVSLQNSSVYVYGSSAAEGVSGNEVEIIDSNISILVDAPGSTSSYAVYGDNVRICGLSTIRTSISNPTGWRYYVFGVRGNDLNICAPATIDTSADGGCSVLVCNILAADVSTGNVVIGEKQVCDLDNFVSGISCSPQVTCAGCTAGYKLFARLSAGVTDNCGCIG